MRSLMIGFGSLLLLSVVWGGCVPVQQRCVADGDCPSLQRCQSGTCTGCQSNDDCSANHTCQVGQCVPSSSGVCQSTERQCEGNTLKVCRSDGSGWAAVPCGEFHVCADGQCKRKQLSTCGNNTVESGEQCDDGNQISGDGCSRHCLKENVEIFEPMQAPQGMEGSPFVLGSRTCRSSTTRNKYANTTSTLYVKVSPIICKLDDKDVISLDEVKSHINFLSNVYKGAHVKFVLGSVRYETDKDECEVFFDTEGSSILRKYSKRDAISVFYARNIFGGNFPIGGFANLSGVVMNASAFGQRNILAHELGHSFGLDHPHSCYHGKDTSSRTCGTRGDQLCDTPADPGPAGVNGLDRCSDGTTKNGACTVTRCESISCPGGEKPHFKNLMSYYHCGVELTQEQNLVVRCVAENDQKARTSARRPCTVNTECDGGTCESGFCTNKPANVCTAHSQCTDGKVCVGGQCGTCRADGLVVSDVALCCGKKVDNIGRCCTGNNCCLSSVNAFVTSTGACQCKDGYERIRPGDASDVRCQKIVPQCVADGDSASSDAACCSHERNDQGKCCTGKVCCGPQNNSFTTSSGKCTCNSGYEWVTTNDPKDFRCQLKQQPTCKADGEAATSATDCCSKERDDSGVCCRGVACCTAAVNAVPGANGACSCQAGYVRINPQDPNDVRCKVKPAAAVKCTLQHTFSAGGFLRSGHTDIISNMAFSSDGKTLASASWDKTIILWDVSANKRIRTIKGHTSGVTGVVFSLDGKTLYTVGYDKTIRSWNVSTGKQTQALSLFEPQRSLAIRPDGKQLMLGSQGGFQLWDIATRRGLVPSSSYYVRSGAYYMDSSRVATGTKSQSVQVWDTRTGRQLAQLNGHQSIVYGLDYSGDGKYLASADQSQVRVWDGKTHSLIHQLTVAGAYSLSFRSTSSFFATGHKDAKTRLWDAKSGKLLQTLSDHTSGVYAVKFSADGQQLATGSKDKTVRLYRCQ
ncbi:MAG: hypothetical protein CL920_26135 [Deltaproteobacteria bacterium]|nr:hypothetical protein [Deltaproteobacteria bacterium]